MLGPAIVKMVVVYLAVIRFQLRAARTNPERRSSGFALLSYLLMFE